MSRGSLISFSSLLLGLCCVLAGCRGNQYARVIKPGDKEMIGSHTAGQETFGPLVDEAVGKTHGATWSSGNRPRRCCRRRDASSTQAARLFRRRGKS